MFVEIIFNRTVECACKCEFYRCECLYFHEMRCTTLEAHCFWDASKNRVKFSDCEAFDAETGEEVDINLLLECDKQRARYALRDEGSKHVGTLRLEWELVKLEKLEGTNAYIQNAG